MSSTQHDVAKAIAALTASPLFPFDEHLQLKALSDPMATELVREGEGDKPCKSCGDDDRVLWSNDRWKVTPLRPTANPVALFLETVDHVDFEDFDAAMAAEYGVLSWHLERAISRIDAVGRVHIHRWGDGSAHFHVWLQGRPARQLELYGWGNVLWPQLLPPLPAAEIDAHHAQVISALTAAVGT